MVVCQAVVHDAPHCCRKVSPAFLSNTHTNKIRVVRTLLARLWALRAPPEPRALRLVQRAPQHWHTRIRELLKLYGDGVDVFDEERVVCVGRVGKCSLDIEIRRSSVKSRPPSLLLGIIQPGRRTPMPDKRDNSALLAVGNSMININTRRAARDAGFGVVHEIDTEDCRCLADVGGYPVEAGLVLLAGKDVFAVDAAEVGEEGFCVGVGVLVDRGGGDFVGPTGGAGGERDRVDQVPAPVVLDLNGVGASVEQDLTGGHGRPCCGGRQRDLASASAVQDNICVFVAIGAVIDEFEVVEFGLSSGNNEGDFVGRFIEAFDVAGA